MGKHEKATYNLWLLKVILMRKNNIISQSHSKTVDHDSNEVRKDAFEADLTTSECAYEKKVDIIL